MELQLTDLERHVRNLFQEIQNFQEIAQNVKPSPGELPSLPGIDICGESLPLAGIVGGDHIIYIDFKKRFDLDARIREAVRSRRPAVARRLENLKQHAAILVADVSGHRITDALLTAMLHQSFLLGVHYELCISGEISTRLFESINARFYQSSMVGKFITMLYGEISADGTFRFISAAHPAPVIFSYEFDRFVEICPDRLVTFPPIGTMPSREDVDARRLPSPLGLKERYTVNELSLMGHHDLLILYTDGLADLTDAQGGHYFPDRLQEVLRQVKDQPAGEICATIRQDLQEFGKSNDDISFVLIKKS